MTAHTNRDDLGTGQHTVLIVGHVVPFQPHTGNEQRVHMLIKWLRSKNVKIILVLNKRLIGNRQVLDSRCLVDEIHYSKENFIDYLRSLLFRLLMIFYPFRKGAELKRCFAAPEVIRKVRELCRVHTPKAVFAEYLFTTPCFTGLSESILKIVDTHDVFNRKREEVDRFCLNDVLHCTASEERHYLLKADIIMAVQGAEARLFKALVPERDIITVGVDYLTSSDHTPSVCKNSSNLLFVGSNHIFNIHGIKEFIRRAWPCIRNSNSAVTLTIVGDVSSQLTVNDERIFLKGKIPDLSDEYMRAAIVINPIIAGTGLKIKAIEALSNGKALVTMKKGVEGIMFNDDLPCVVCEDWESFAESILRLLESAEERASYERKALFFSKENLFSDVVYRQLEDKIFGN